MPTPRFTTMADLDVLEAFFLAEPPSTAPLDKKQWSEAWWFLSNETDLVFDVPRAELQARLDAGDPFVLTLFQSGLHRYGRDEDPKIRHPWRLYVERTPKSRAGMLSVDAMTARPEISRVRTARSVAFQKGEHVPPDLERFQTPTCGLILVDPHLLSAGPSGLRQSVAPLLASLVPDNAGRFPILVVCGAVERDADGRPKPGSCPHLRKRFASNSDRARTALEAEIRARTRGTEASVTLVVNGQAMKDYHDRHVFTRYYEMHTSRSVDRLTVRNLVLHDASFDGFSTLDAFQRDKTLALLSKVKDIVDTAPQATISGAPNHPLFALLAT